MTSQKVQLLGKEVELKCSGYSLILYEDEFHRNFIKDFRNILGIDDKEVETGNYIRFIWAFAKTADSGCMSVNEFSKSCELNEVFALVNFVVDAINHSLGNYEEDPKTEAAAQ